MKQYYIISLKHTSKADSAVTLWRANSNGYCWFQNWAGIYSDAELGKGDKLNVFVEKELADPLFEMTVYDGEIRMVLRNLPSVWDALNLNPKLMKPKKYRSCHMSF